MNLVKKRKNDESFDDIWEMIRKVIIVAGIFVFPGITKNVWLKRALMLNAAISFGIVLILAYGTFELNNYSLISHILVHSILINYVTVLYGCFCIKRNEMKMLEFFNFCANLYKYRETFHRTQYDIVKRQLTWAHKWTVRIIQGAAFVLWVDSTMITLGFAFVGYFLPESIYPKLSAPMPYYYPFKNQKTWPVFLVTLVSQFKCAMDLSSIHLLLLSIFYTISIHIHSHLNIIKQTIELMGKDLQAKHDQMSHRLVGHEPSIKWKQTLRNGNNMVDVNENPKNDELLLVDWIKQVVDMISQSNQIISSFAEIFTGYFFLFEFSSFGSLFVFGMIMLVLHQQYFFAFGIICASVILFTFCFINEQFLEKFAQISLALYDIPWYILTPKERKIFLIVMTCSEIQKGFKASGIHGVTFERFNKIVQAAYSNVLVLKDLVMKF